MGYLPRTAERRSDVRRVLPSARSVIVTGTVYHTGSPYSTERRDTALGEIAQYAHRDDYHDVLGRRLEALLEWMRREHPEPFDARPYVDTGPVQERVYAQYAGLGWIGKNTCVINPEVGSWMLLAEVICSLSLEPDPPALDQCGTCMLCLDACPTNAFVEPHVLDATRCLSYLTIEYRGSIPRSAKSRNHLRLRHLPGGLSLERSGGGREAAWPSREISIRRCSSTCGDSDQGTASAIGGTPLTRAGVKDCAGIAVALRKFRRRRRARALSKPGGDSTREGRWSRSIEWARENGS